MTSTSTRPTLGPVICVVGARPNYMKMAPIIRAFKERQSWLPVILVHTGQHYDHDMNARLFSDLDLPRPDINLEVGSGSHAIQTAEIMRRFDPLLDEHSPSAVLVVGDVNSTLACSLVAAKRRVPVVHVEAGLRSFDRTMPEEVNRILTDQLSDLLYTTERKAHEHLKQEGIEARKAHFVGNVMIDTLRTNLPKAVPVCEILARAGIGEDRLGIHSRFGVVTLHRPANVDHPDVLSELLVALAEVASHLPLVFALHPRTRSNAERFGMGHLLQNENFIVLPPQGYLEMLGLMSNAAVVLTDSGGIQEETTALSVPCITLRENTERPITVEQGTNTVVGRNRQRIVQCVAETLADGGKRGRVPELWDGHAADRIVDHLAMKLTAGISEQA